MSRTFYGKGPGSQAFTVKTHPVDITLIFTALFTV